MFLDANQRHTAKLFMESFGWSAKRKGRALFQRDELPDFLLVLNEAEVPLIEDGSGSKGELECEGTQWSAWCACGRDECEHSYAAFMMMLRLDDDERNSEGAAAETGPDVKLDGRLALDELLRLKTGRKLKAAEKKIATAVMGLHGRIERGERLSKWDLETHFFFHIYNAPHPLPVHPGLNPLQFWNCLAVYLRKHGGRIPPELMPITDMAALEAEEERNRWQQRLMEWRGTVPLLAESAAPKAVEVVELRICFEQDAARLQKRADPQSPFRPIKAREWQDLTNGVGSGAVSLDAQSLQLYLNFAMPANYGDPRINYSDSHQKQPLAALFQAPELKERLVNADGIPFERPEGPLQWRLTQKDDKYYQLSLADAEGKTVEGIFLCLPGAPAYYLTPSAAYRGPRFISRLGAGPHLIPIPAMTNSAGVNLLQSLGVELPPALKERTRAIEMKVLLRCKLAVEKYSQSEALHVEAVAVADEIDRVEQYTPGGWWPTGKPKVESNEVFYVFERQAMGLVPKILEALNLKWDPYAEGWRLKVNKAFPEKFIEWHNKLPLEVEVVLDKELASLAQDAIKAEVQLDCEEVGVDWFDLKTTIKVEEMELTPEEIRLLLAAKGRAVRLEGKGWRRLEYNITEEDEQSLARLGLSAVDFSDEPQRLHALQLADPAAEKMLAAEQFRKVQERAAEIKTRVTPDLPETVQATLRPYQLEGYHFLAYLAENRFGGILADDMGLGKTVQTLTWLAWVNSKAVQRKPSLVVCPKSVVDNWRSEANKFVPGLKVHLWSGAGNGEDESGNGKKLAEIAAANDLLVLNYAQLRNMAVELSNTDFGAVILDEGQYIKNPDSQTAQAARTLRADHRLVLSGTPIENRLMDLWSLMQFAMPGIMGNRASFKRRFDSASDPFARRRLASRVRPFLLRRTKTQVASDLPDRTEEEIVCELEGNQKTLYRAEFKRAQQMLLKVKTQKELNEFRFNFLTSLLRLRQICCHPALVDAQFKKEESAKMNALLDLLEPLMEEGHKVLIFSQFVTMLELIRGQVKKRKWPHFFLDGSTEDRGDLVREFQNHEGSAVFLISLKAGGFGLNLTAASYVVIFDPWWNPAVENQAIDRTHRIGQTQKVIAYRLITKGSIEEKIRSLQKQKSALAQDILGDEAFASSLTVDDLQYLFSDGPED